MELCNDSFWQSNQLWNFTIQSQTLLPLSCLILWGLMLPFQESFHKCEIIHCRYLWTDSIYESKSNYFIILSPPIYPCNWNGLSSYGLFDSCKLNGITEQQVLQETVPVTGNENKSKVLLAQLSTCSSVGHLTKPEMLHLVLLGDTSGSNIDLCSYLGKLQNCHI